MKYVDDASRFLEKRLSFVSTNLSNEPHQKECNECVVSISCVVSRIEI